MRLIDKDAIPWDVEGVGEIPVITKEEIDEMPTVDAVHVRHGKWVGAESQCGIGCPFCGTPVDDFCVSIDYIELLYEPNYCPNCGAKMDEEDDDETN